MEVLSAFGRVLSSIRKKRSRIDIAPNAEDIQVAPDGNQGSGTNIPHHLF